MPNKYLDRLEKLVDSYRSRDFPQFCGPTGGPAQWGDSLWLHICPTTGLRTSFLADKHDSRRRGIKGRGGNFKLRSPYDGLIKVWVIQTTNVPVSPRERQARVSTARKLLTHMEGELYVQTAESVTTVLAGRGSLARINPFLEFCAENGLMPRIYVKSPDNRDRTGHAAFDARKDKLPELDNVLLLAAIHNEIFQPVSQSGLVSPEAKIPVMDAVATTFGILGLASPSRLCAEVPLLAKQRLKRYSEGGRETVHYLDWPGSKGYKDNRNHVLAVVADQVERAINFFFNECEPARILCRFYENPKLSLGELLGDSEKWQHRARHLRLDRAPPNLFVLGYALGFYPEAACVPVVLPGVEVQNDLPHNAPAYRSYFTGKPIHSLESCDRLACSTTAIVKINSVPYLFGYRVLLGKSVRILGLDKNSLITVSELQARWVSYFKTELVPTFPESNSTGEGMIRLADALFCINGLLRYRDQTEVRSGGKPLAKALYSVAPLKSVALNAAALLSRGNMFQKSLFEKRGYKGCHVLPHSLRHLGNTLAELSEIPREIITAWSGRRDPEQTDTYLHDKHEEQSRRVRMVMNPREHDKREIRVVGQEAVAKATNLPASIMSTGICTQELHLDPCDYLNDFISQCFMCSAACHVAGDIRAIELLERNYQVQLARLAQVKLDGRLVNSLAMQKWFVIHSRNTHVLASLLDFMKTQPLGSVIRYSANKSEFHITDANVRKAGRVPLLIPNFENELVGLLEQRSAKVEPSDNPGLSSLLQMFGI